MITSERSPGGSRILEVDSLTKVFTGRTRSTEAVGEISFGVQEGEFVSLCGPSGCGKTTLLRLVAGLLSPTDGTVRLEGHAVDRPPEAMAVVFQEYSRSLMPWMTVYDNVKLPLRQKRLTKQEQQKLIADSLDEVDLAGFADYYPWQLSGGMQQRVAIARALGYQPRILLLDEPFASVDAQTRADLQDLILRVRRDHGVTLLLVTHDVDEAVYLSDRVIVLTHRPAQVADIVTVDLPQPRDQVVTKQLPRFADLRTRVFQQIRGRDRTAE